MRARKHHIYADSTFGCLQPRAASAASGDQGTATAAMEAAASHECGHMHVCIYTFVCALVTSTVRSVQCTRSMQCTVDRCRHTCVPHVPHARENICARMRAYTCKVCVRVCVYVLTICIKYAARASAYLRVRANKQTSKNKQPNKHTCIRHTYAHVYDAHMCVYVQIPIMFINTVSVRERRTMHLHVLLSAAPQAASPDERAPRLLYMNIEMFTYIGI